MKISILEPGAWGTALGILLTKKNDVSFWYEDKKLALKIDRLRENEKLSEVKIPKKIFISPDLERTIEGADLIIIASPSFNFRKTLRSLKKFKRLPPFLGIAKGIEKESLKLPSQIVEEIFGKIPYAHLSGPGFAREIIRGKKSKEVIASKNRDLLKRLKRLFKIKPLRISTTTDLIGVQLTGVLKNTLTIGISLVEAASGNPEAKKVKKDLILLGLKEMIKIGKTMGGKEKTFLGPAGLGDLILTSTNPLSRNFQFGKNLYFNAQKMRQDIKERKITVEGFDNAWALHKLGKKYKLDLPGSRSSAGRQRRHNCRRQAELSLPGLPMLNEIYKVIYKKTSPEKTIKNLIELAKIM